MKNFGCMCIALGALLYGSDVYGHYALDVLEQVNSAFGRLPKKEAEFKDTEERWKKEIKEVLKKDRSYIRLEIDSETGALKFAYQGKAYVEDKNLSGELIQLKSTAEGFKAAGSMMPGEIQKYGNWKHRKFAIGDQNEIELWWIGNSMGNAIVVNNAKLNVSCCIKADNVFFLGSNQFNKDAVIAATNAFSNLGDYIITQQCKIFTHHGTNFGLMAHEAPNDPNRITVGLDEADRMFYKMPLDDDEQSLDSLVNILKSDGFTDFGTSAFDNVRTDSINFNTYGNTTVKNFTQSGNHRNMNVLDFLPTEWLFPWFYRMYFDPCLQFKVNIGKLTGIKRIHTNSDVICEEEDNCLRYSSPDNSTDILVDIVSNERPINGSMYDRHERQKKIGQQFHEKLLPFYNKECNTSTCGEIWNQVRLNNIHSKNVYQNVSDGYIVYLGKPLKVVFARFPDGGIWTFFYVEKDIEAIPFSYAVDYYLTQKLNDPSDTNNYQQEDVRLDLNTTIEHLNRIQQLAKQFNENGRIPMQDPTGL